jgi:ATP-dependent DNA ligase
MMSRAKRSSGRGTNTSKTAGEVVFEHACKMGLGGIVAKRLDIPYKSGRAKCWIKVKNPKSAAAPKAEQAAE